MKSNDKENFHRRGNDAIDACVRIYGVCIGGVTSGDWTYTVNDDETTATITGYSGSGGTVTIPETIDSQYTVAAIGEKVFYDKRLAITNVTVPGTVKTIGKEAFVDCTKITAITLSDGLETIGDSAFKNCGFTTITIPSTVKTISAGAFNGGQLKSIVIPSGVKTIGEAAFTSCTKLESVTIPATVTSIGANVFYGCSKLKNVELQSGLKIIGEKMFYQCKALESITIPDTVETIGNSAFYKCTALKSIEIPSGVKTLGQSVLSGCTALTSAAVLCDSLPYSALENCTSLTDVTLFENLKSIGAYAFFKCSKLKNITLPENLTTIEEDAFYKCTSLDNVAIPKSVTQIKTFAFNGCTRLKTLTMYNNNFSNFGTQVFTGCNIEEAYFDADKTQWDSKMREYTVNKVYYHTTDADKAVTEYANEKDKATGFVATIKSDYEYAYTEMIDKLMWRITSGGKTVNAATALDGAIELETGASATFGIVLDGLYDENATATISAEVE